MAACAPPVPPDYEYPRLVLVLPPSVSAAIRDWYLFARASFVEDVDVHLLCENPTYWHFVDGSVYRIRPQATGGGGGGAAAAAARGRTVGRPVPIQLVALAAAVLRVVACGQSGRLVGAVVAELVRSCAQLFPPVDFDLGVRDVSRPSDAVPPETSKCRRTARFLGRGICYSQLFLSGLFCVCTFYLELSTGTHSFYRHPIHF